MPAAIPIIAAVVGAISAGEGIYSITHQPSSSPTPSTPAPPSATQIASTRQNQEEAITQQFPQLQAQTGGSLSPNTWVQMAELLSNQANSPGIGAAGQDILMKLFQSNPQFMVTAGNSPTGTGPTTSTGLTAGANG